MVGAVSASNVSRATTADRDTDHAYAFAVGLYAGVLLGPAVVLVLSRWVASAVGLYVGLLASVTTVAVGAGWLASRTPALGARVGRHAAAWLLAAAPLAWFAGVFGAAAFGVEPPDVAGVLAMLGAAGGVLLGLVVVSMSRMRYADAATRDGTELAAWEARWPERWRQAAIAVVLAAFVVGVAGIVAESRFGVEGAGAAYWLALFAVPLAAPTTAPRTLRATDAGLVVERPHQRRFRPWTAFSGYELTGDALVVRTAAWWRPAHRCDRADVEDVDGVVAALEDVFERPAAERNGRGRQSTGTDGDGGR